MNERLKALCEEAFTEAWESRKGSDGLVRTDGNPYIFYEKFVELLVRECAEIADRAEPYKANDLILKHFGVEL
jgi:hypothetical protein